MENVIKERYIFQTFKISKNVFLLNEKILYIFDLKYYCHCTLLRLNKEWIEIVFYIYMHKESTSSKYSK